MSRSDIFIHDSAVVDEGADVGSGTKIWHFSHVMPEAVIGEDCVLGQNVFVGDRARIGNSVKIQNNVSVYEGVILEDEVFCGPSMVFTNVINPRSGIERKDEFRTTHVKKGATLGANAVILCGNTIGTYAMVGAGAVVTRPVADYALVMGSPARRKGWVSRSGHRLEFEKGRAACPETGEEYVLKDDRVSLLES